MTIESKMILGATASPATLSKVGVEGDGTAQFMVFQTVVDGKTYYCCHSGGAVVNGQVMLTDVGLAALESLAGLPLPPTTPAAPLVMKELRIGQTPLVDKVKATFRMLPEGSRVCFFGDLTTELDGHMGITFNVTGAIGIGEIAAGGESCLH